MTLRWTNRIFLHVDWVDGLKKIVVLKKKKIPPPNGFFFKKRSTCKDSIGLPKRYIFFPFLL